jgi:uncharacterized protein YacL
MVCSFSCIIATVFMLGMIYFYNATRKNKTVLNYRAQLPPNLRDVYDKISLERLYISIKGYILGLMLSLFIIYYNLQKKRLSSPPIVCIVLATTFLTNYFFYILSPKTDWMLNHITDAEQTQAWLKMYQTMQYYYHMGMVLGIVGVGVLAYAFRC